MDANGNDGNDDKSNDKDNDDGDGMFDLNLNPKELQKEEETLLNIALPSFNGNEDGHDGKRKQMHQTPTNNNQQKKKKSSEHHKRHKNISTHEETHDETTTLARQHDETTNRIQRDGYLILVDDNDDNDLDTEGEKNDLMNASHNVH
eukprot:909648-Ditylum_brightwellii.AAC.1